MRNDQHVAELTSISMLKRNVTKPDTCFLGPDGVAADGGDGADGADTIDGAERGIAHVAPIRASILSRR